MAEHRNAILRGMIRTVVVLGLMTAIGSSCRSFPLAHAEGRGSSERSLAIRDALRAAENHRLIVTRLEIASNANGGGSIRLGYAATLKGPIFHEGPKLSPTAKASRLRANTTWLLAVSYDTRPGSRRTKMLPVSVGEETPPSGQHPPRDVAVDNALRHACQSIFRSDVHDGLYDLVAYRTRDKRVPGAAYAVSVDWYSPSDTTHTVVFLSPDMKVLGSIRSDKPKELRRP